MLVNGINYFFVSLYPLPTGHEPLAVQLMNGVVNSHLIDVVVGIQLVTGALILIGVFVPAALCVVMPHLRLRGVLGAARSPCLSTCCSGSPRSRSMAC